MSTVPATTGFAPLALGVLTIAMLSPSAAHADDAAIFAALRAEHDWDFGRRPWRNYAREYGLGSRAAEDEQALWCTIFGFTSDGVDQFPTIEPGLLSRLRNTAVRGLFVENYRTLELTDGILDELAGLTQLEYVCLVDVELTPEHVAALGKMPNLQRVLLVHTGARVVDVVAGLGEKPKLREVQVVDRYEPRLAHGVDRATARGIVAQFPALQELRVRAPCWWTAEALETLAGLEELRTLQFDGPPRTAGGRRLPGVPRDPGRRAEFHEELRANVERHVRAAFRSDATLSFGGAALDVTRDDPLWPEQPSLKDLVGKERAERLRELCAQVDADDFRKREAGTQALEREVASWGRDGALAFCRAVTTGRLQGGIEANRRLATVADRIAADRFQRRLTGYGEAGSGAAVLPDGRIVLTRDGDLWTLDVETGERERLTKGTQADSPAALPDGRIVYRRGKYPYDGVLWLFDPKTGEREQLTRRDDPHPHVGARHPAAMRDGRIVFASSRSGKGELELWLLDLESRRHYRLTSFVREAPHAGSGSPAVLPDGRIVFATDKSRNNTRELWLLDPETWGLRQLTRFDEAPQTVDSNHPVALPNGRVVYSRQRTLHPHTGNHELWVLDPDTGWKTRLTRFDRRRAPRKRSFDDYPQAALPDGRVVFSRYVYEKGPDGRGRAVSALWVVDPAFAPCVHRGDR